MRLELKPFQTDAARLLLDELAEARESARRGKLQAVILSAPTGSGKTITLASVIDQTLGGGDGVLARPDTVFLWLSDSPELNAQSKAKLLNTCDNLPFHKMVTIDGESFDEERLYPSHLYFINTQLLGKDKLLTQNGDKRNFTFWQTVANTVAEGPERFVLIIDEAHRGTAANDRTRTPIMQKFILGSEHDGLPAVPLVLGMSATPQRFTALLGNTNRTQRPVNISADQVRSSGLLKDMILVHNPKVKAASDLTLLEQAAKRWMHFTKLWESYCHKEHEELVRPILVVQVEDGTEKVVTRTPLGDVVRVIERQLGSLSPNEIVHCFQDRQELEAGGRIVRKLEASRIQDSSEVKVVLFKTALSTGWDCPRAEIMMSFRRAQDATNIAQLVGRMIRTPLARRISQNEILDTVELFLPHYDSAALEGVLTRLRNPEAEEGIPTRVESLAEEYPRNSTYAHAFHALKGLPTYSINRAPKMGEIKRALRLAGMLVHEGIDKNADEGMRDLLTVKLKELRDSYAQNDPDWNKYVSEGGEIDVDVSMVAIGEMTVVGKNEIRMTLSEENIDRLFDAAGRKIAAGEGLHRSYWKRYHDFEKPNQAKLELFAVARHASSIEVLEKLALSRFSALWIKYKASVQQLPAAEKARFTALLQASGSAVQQDWELPDEIVEKKSGEAWEKHLFCNADGKFFASLNNWEAPLLDEAMKEKGFVCWLRNLDRRDWAFCVPYELGGKRPFYPDFVVVRKEGSTLVVDILEPHDSTRSDAWAKAKGLAEFANEHGLEFGRLIFARKQGDIFQKVDMNDKNTRKKARAMQSQSDLESLFGS
jgi:type III restriction enzyme